MEPIYVLAIVVLSVVAIVYAVAHFRKQINTAKLEAVSTKAFDIAEMFLNANVFDFNNSTKKQIAFVLDVAHDISEFVVEISSDDTEKVQLSKEAVNEILKKLNITPSENEHKLIYTVIEEVIKFIDKK